MDLSKIEMVFDPASVKGRIHIIGCGFGRLYCG